MRRIDEPEKNWKFSMDDMKERKFWKQYISAYEACLSATSFDHAPWYAIPADDKKNARLIISQVIVDALEAPQNGIGQNDATAARGNCAPSGGC